jgi:nitrogen fixation protein NifX
MKERRCGMSSRFALASTSGITVDGHFARTEAFYIYDLENGIVRFREKRICRCPGGHTKESIDEKKAILTDCGTIFVNKIGASIAEHLIQSGFRVYEAPYPVDIVLREIETGKISVQTDNIEEDHNDDTEIK